VARGAGVLLLLAAYAKSAEPIALAQWVGYATNWPPAATWAIAIAVVMYEGVVGTLATLDPLRSLGFLASIYAAFTLLHVAMLVNPDLGRCPCLGSVAADIGPAIQNTILGLVSLFVTATTSFAIARRFLEQRAIPV